MTCAISPGAAKAPGIASAGLGATTTFLLRWRQAAFGELLTTGVFLAGMNQDMQCRRPQSILLLPLARAVLIIQEGWIY